MKGVRERPSIREGDCHIIGRKNAVCAEMRRFLRAVVLGEAN